MYDYELSTKSKTLLILSSVLPNIDLLKKIYSMKINLEVEEERDHRISINNKSHDCYRLRYPTHSIRNWSKTLWTRRLHSINCILASTIGEKKLMVDPRGQQLLICTKIKEVNTRLQNYLDYIKQGQKNGKYDKQNPIQLLNIDKVFIVRQLIYKYECFQKSMINETDYHDSQIIIYS